MIIWCFSWTKISNKTDISFTVGNLTYDHEYMFRVTAVNRAGQSEPSKESEKIRTRKPTQPERPSVQEKLTDITACLASSIVLTCVFSGVPEPDIKWFKDDKRIEESLTYTNHTAKYVVEKTTEQTSGFYKCIAENIHGTAETSCTVIIQDKPTISIEEKYISQQLRIDSEYAVLANIEGYPLPKVVWYKSKTKLESKTNTKIINETNSSVLNISKLKRKDTGKYIIEASNEAGVAKQELVLTVIDKPSTPEGPIITKIVKKDTVTIDWKPSRDDGGLPISSYVIEKCDVQSQIWIKVAEVEPLVLTCSLSKLSTNAQYIFRIIARNPVGDSEALQSEIVTVRQSLERPSAPTGPIEVSGMEDTKFVLSWHKSSSDGGSPIIEYIVELRKSQEDAWHRYALTDPNQTWTAVSRLNKGDQFEFRISARNDVGTSDFLLTEESIIVGHKQSKLKFICEKYA